jgi:ribonuclease HI
MGIGIYAPELFEISRAVGVGTNNEAEFISLETAIDTLAEAGIRSARIHTDSQLLFNQVNGLWKITSETSKKYVPRIQHKLRLGGHKLVWIPREQNREADKLSALATGRKR